MLGSARHLSIALSLLIGLAVLGGSRGARADEAAEGRRHVQRATSLAAAGKCKQAISEFDKALAIVRDPTLLFNRAECHRKLGESEAALEDYNQFLADLPTAPNRDEVKRRIAELSKAAPTAAPAPAQPVPGARPAPAGRSNMSLPSRHASTPDTSGRDASDTPAPRVHEQKPKQRWTTEEDPAPAAPRSTVPVIADSTSAGSDTPLIAREPSQPASPSSASNDSIVSKPWFWVAVGAAVVAAGVGGFLIFGRDSTNVPQSTLGNYKF